MGTAEQKLASMAAHRLGLFTLKHALEAGLTRRQLYHRVNIGLYERVGESVFAIAGVPFTWERRARAALMVTSPLASISHRAAAHLLGFDGFGECPIELLVPRGVSSNTALAVVHSTTYLHRLDLISVRGFPATSGARTIVDLCASGADEDSLSAAIGSATRDGYTSVAFLRRRIDNMRGSGRAGIRVLDRTLEGPIAHSHLERAFLKLVRAAGIRVPETQVIFDGERVIRVDTLWRPEWVIVEVMGHRFHVTREQLQRDAQRRNELQEFGARVLEFTTVDVARRPAYCMGQLSRSLTARQDGREADKAFMSSKSTCEVLFDDMNEPRREAPAR